MCTLTLAWQVFADAPVVVAANRDEQRDRPSEPPAQIESDPVVVAPRDAQAGGTWLGYNESGLFVGVTNRWVDADLAGERSRGLLVRDALRESSAEEAVRMVENAVEDDEYAGFNLVLADASAAFLLEWDGRLIVRRFDPGVHVVVNVGASDAPVFPEERPERGQEQAQDAAAVQTELIPEPGETSDEWLARAKAVLGDHDYGVCVHENGYGTVSASVLAIGAADQVDEDAAYGDDHADGEAGYGDGHADGEAAYGDGHADGEAAVGGVRFEFADGPPCETEFEPVDAAVDVE